MPKVTEDYLESRRDEILDAAEAVIADQGLQGATLAAIRDAAGVSSGAVYHYFKSKDDIVAGIRERSIALDEEFYAVASESGSARQALQALLQAGIELNRGAPGNRDARLAVMLWAEALVNARIHETQMQLLAPWWTTAEELGRRAVNEGDLEADVDLEALATLLAAISLGATVLEAWEPARADLGRLIETAQRLFDGQIWRRRE